MSSINYTTKEIHFKVVYYGPGLCGKTTSLQFIHRCVPTTHKGDLVSLATQTDRTLFFDFLPLDTISVGGFKIKFQLYTVPGQVHYNATRKLVLRGADGVIFVADSQWQRMKDNVESFRNLHENLKSYGLDVDSVPYVLQYNKRDLKEIAPVKYLEFLLNSRHARVPSYESSALYGRGIFETLNTVGKLVIRNFSRSAMEEGMPV